MVKWNKCFTCRSHTMHQHHMGDKKHVLYLDILWGPPLLHHTHTHTPLHTEAHSKQHATGWCALFTLTIFLYRSLHSYICVLLLYSHVWTHLFILLSTCASILGKVRVCHCGRPMRMCVAKRHSFCRRAFVLYPGKSDRLWKLSHCNLSSVLCVKPYEYITFVDTPRQ